MESSNRAIEYIGLFLTFDCNHNCSYCLNHYHSKLAHRKLVSGKEWAEIINLLYARYRTPITLQGGEPTRHPEFFRIIQSVNPYVELDLLTNLTFDVDFFVKNVPRQSFSRNAPYAPIRATFHPEYSDPDEMLIKTEALLDAGHRTGLYGIQHPDPELWEKTLAFKERCEQSGIDFRVKEFLGKWNGKVYGTYKYLSGIDGDEHECMCKTSEVLIAPDGRIYRCHSDLYQDRNSLGLLNEASDEQLNKFLKCEHMGDCHPCDLKIKTNRYQQFGHTSVEIVNLNQMTGHER